MSCRVHVRILEPRPAATALVHGDPYVGTSTWNNPKNTGQFHGTGSSWTLADPTNLQPYNTTGYQTVRFTLKPGGTASRFQVYDLYVDPRLRG